MVNAILQMQYVGDAKLLCQCMMEIAGYGASIEHLTTTGVVTGSV